MLQHRPKFPLQFLNELKSVGTGDMNSGKLSFQLNKDVHLSDMTSLKLRFAFPVITDSEILMVVKSADTNTTPLTAYLRHYRDNN